MTITHESPAASSVADSPLSSLWAEVTGMCQLSCVHCYAGSGPDSTHGTMSADDWETVLTDAAALGTRMVCVMGVSRPCTPIFPGLSVTLWASA
jgi:MoaA/NifB/PqqE/SkfB family radical SAM enzyme